MRFDSNYTSLVRALQMYASYLADAGHDTEAIRLLEYAIDSKSDVSASYKLLGELYMQSGRTGEIDRLITKAGELDSPMSASIIRNLEKIKTSASA